MPLRPRMRPEFTIACPGRGSLLFPRLNTLLASGLVPYVGQVLDRHAYLQLPESRRSLLSPYLNLQLVEEEGESRLKGRFTPHPGVWTGFMAVYGILAMGGICGLVFGLAQLTVKETPWALLAVPLALGLAAFVYGAAVIGQGLTMDQMYELRVFIEDLIRQDGRPEGAPAAAERNIL